MDSSLQAGIADSALAFRGYNVKNLGRTAELLAVPAYAPLLREELAKFGEICAATVGRPVDLARFVAEGVEPTLDEYAESVALVVAVESAHLRILREVHAIDWSDARLSFGYSLGEIHAVGCGGLFKVEDLVRVPLALADDCAAMAHDCTMGVLFSRGPAVPEHAVERLCGRVTAENGGTIGISAILSPNTFLLIGQGDSVQRFRSAMLKDVSPEVHMRINEHRWPPLHTPIVRQRNIADRASVMVEKLPTGVFPPIPDVSSLVTGRRNYAEHSARDILRQWVDRPQRLWDVVCDVLAAGVKTILHLGPDPNVMPATFTRLSENLKQQQVGRSPQSYGMRAISGMANRPWLAAMLPARAALLRAPFVRQVIVENWLLENPPG